MAIWLNLEQRVHPAVGETAQKFYFFSAYLLCLRVERGGAACSSIAGAREDAGIGNRFSFEKELDAGLLQFSKMLMVLRLCL